MPVCCRSVSEIRAGYALQALALQQHSGELKMQVYIHDEGPVPVVSDRWTRLTMDLLSARGHSVNCMRRAVSQGVGAARHELLRQIPPDFERVLLVDDA